MFLLLVLLIFLPPPPLALASAASTEEPLSDVTTYQSTEELEDTVDVESASMDGISMNGIAINGLAMDDPIVQSTLQSHSHPLLVDLLKTQNQLVEATKDVAKATKVRIKS